MDTRKLEITKGALYNATSDQIAAVWGLMLKFHEVVVGMGGPDLPHGYLTFIETYESGTRVYGGISPEGRIST